MLSREGYYCLNQGLYEGKLPSFFLNQKHLVVTLKLGIWGSFYLLLSLKNTNGHNTTSLHLGRMFLAAF